MWRMLRRLLNRSSRVPSAPPEAVGDVGTRPEPVRLVIWDLDDTFWNGTLTEGGIEYLQANHDVVVELAQRGIVSSICSRNDHAEIEAILRERGIWDYFVFPSIDWTSKGPRIRRIVEAVQLRAPTILFIDDNPMNRAEAASFVDGIRVADPATMRSLLDDPLCKGKRDDGLTRLAQYKLLERRASAMDVAGSSEDFLRESGITVSIETDVVSHLDRAVELINRTNQLNFTKRRLPDDVEEARQALRVLLERDDIDAGLVHVRDRYGDYGQCGLYVRDVEQDRLVHYCFSCRTLGMDVETWFYRNLGSPAVELSGQVLVDIHTDKKIDWIGQWQSETSRGSNVTGDRRLARVFMRGGCETVAISPYFGDITRDLVLEFSYLRDGFNVRLDHSLMLRQALTPPDANVMASLSTLGYTSADLATRFAETVDGPCALVLGLWAEANDSVFRHKNLGLQTPIYFNHTLGVQAAELHLVDPSTRLEIKQVQWAMDGMTEVLDHYEHVGIIPQLETITNILEAAALTSPDARIFLLGVTERYLAEDGTFHPFKAHSELNQALRSAAASHDRVEFVDIEQFVSSPADRYGSHNHYTREAYFKIANEVRQRIDRWLGEGAGDSPSD